MVHVNFQVPDDLHKALKICAFNQGKKIKEALLDAVENYVLDNAKNEVKLDVKIVKSVEKKDLLTFIMEEDLKNLMGCLLEAKKRNAPLHFIKEKKKEIMEVIKRYPSLTKDLADQIVSCLKAIQ